MKKCSKCGVEKELTEFNRCKRSSDGLNSQCRCCTKSYIAGWMSNKPEPNPDASKECAVCSELKLISEFHKHARGKFGRVETCKRCVSIAEKLKTLSSYAELDVTQVKLCTKCNVSQSVSEFSRSRKGKFGVINTCKKCSREYDIARAEVKQSVADAMGVPAFHLRKNRYMNAVRTAKYRATKLDATPEWVDQFALAAIYEYCAYITKSSGIPHHVDHIVPLSHPLVCGLHVHWNLQIITLEDNHKKSNKFIVS